PPPVMKASATQTGAGSAAPLPDPQLLQPRARRGPSFWPILLGVCVGLGLGSGATIVFQQRTAKKTEMPMAVEPQAAVSPWLRIKSGTDENLYSIWGSGPKDIWAVGGDGHVVHFDGKSWQREKVSARSAHLEALRAVWGSGPSSVWAIGQAG